MAQQTVITEPQKTSFAESLGAGIKGSLKGLLAGAAIGILSGGLIGAAIGGVAALTGFTAIGVGAAALAGAMGGAFDGGFILGALGTLAGTVTGVVQSREKNQVSGQDVANVATISYAQGMGVGRTMGKEQAAQEAQSHFRDKILAERAARSKQQQQVH